MSAIDQYRYQCIGMIHCPTSYGSVLISREGTGIDVALYKLCQDIPTDERDFQGKAGDILLGGGSGEAPALRISIPEAFLFWTSGWDSFDSHDEITKAYWSMTSAYVLGEGYVKLDWDPKISIEYWLTQHVLSFLIKNYPDEYSKHLGSELLELDGSICRLLTPDEGRMLNPQDYR